MFKQPQSIILLLLIVLIFVIGLFTGGSCNPKHSQKIETLQDSVLIYRERLTVLEKQFNTLGSLDRLYLNKVSLLETNIQKLKSKYNVEKTHVSGLGNDSSFLYLSDWLSQTDSIR